MKILFGIPSPFDYSIVKKYQKGIKYDKIIPRYYPEIKAYEIIRDYFLKNKKYTHLMIASSDIVVSNSNIRQLEDDIKELDPPIISGLMNIALEALNVYNITKNVVRPEHFSSFEWYTEKDLESKPDIFQVAWSGFPLICLRRDIVERFEFEDLGQYLNNPELYSGLDVILCWKLYQNNIPILVDKRVKLLHLKQLITESEETLVGKKQPVVETC